METAFGSLAVGLRKFATIANGWLARPAHITLPEDDRFRLIGRYRTKDGQYFEVTGTEDGFHIQGLSQRELSPIDNVTLFDSGDPESIVRFRDLQKAGYSYLVVTHPLRLTITAARV